MSRAGLAGHAAGLLTIFLWGTTFISTKVLLTGLRPVEVLFLRFALCFVTWGFAVGRLGAVRTSAYIYLVPVVTLVTSALVLGEPVTPLSLGGAVLTVAGLALSEWEPRKEGSKGGVE